MIRLCAACFVLSAGFAQAACAPLPDDGAERAALHGALRVAPDEATARPLSQALWALWTTAPDGAAQEVLDVGMARLRVSDFEAAIGAFDRLVAYCPDYAEGYNQRAFARYLSGDYALALADLDLALAREPRHLGALTGRALTLIGLGRDGEALAQLEAALVLHPWLSERALVPALKARLGARDL